MLEARGFNFACVKLKAFELYIYPKTFKVLTLQAAVSPGGRYEGRETTANIRLLLYRAAVQRYGRIN